MQTIDVIIPTYRPGKEFLELLRRLGTQTVSVGRIIIMNTEEKYFDRLTYGMRFAQKYPNVEVYHVSKREFDHGGTRNRGVKRSDADIFVCMTQDAMPSDEKLLEELIRPLREEKVAVSYARQLPASDCGVPERYARAFNYPDRDSVKSKEDLETLGIKTYFCSNVCAAYRRDIYNHQGGFIRHTIFNEDMIYAAGVIQAGYRIAYASRAQVIHSHNYTGREQFHRNFDLGVSQADHPEVFRHVPAESEGVRMVKATAAYLRKNGYAGKIPALLVQSGCKYAGYVLGKHYKSLPRKLVKKCSMNQNYWN